MRKDGDLEVWAKPLEGGAVAVVLFNRGKTAASIPVAWHEVGLGWEAEPVVRDLWAHTDLGRIKAYCVAEVPPHDVVVVRVSR